MVKISVVIIIKNESANIVDCIRSAKKVSSNIIVIDTGSDDDSVALAESENALVRSVHWTNYGAARNAGAKMAAHDWILALDADERITDKLAASIINANLSNDKKIIGFGRINFLGEHKIIHGPLGHDRVFRIYNRKQAAWDHVQVHEKLVGNNMICYTLPAKAAHYGNKNPGHYLQKKIEYALLWAEKHRYGKKHAGMLLRFSSTAMSFIKAYFIQLGVLDLRYGFTIAKINAYYTWYKYGLLQKMNSEPIPVVKADMNLKLKDEIKPILQNYTAEL